MISIELFGLYRVYDLQKIHDILSKHNFNTDAAAAELSRSYTQTIMQGSYSQWKEEYDRNSTRQVGDAGPRKRYAEGEPSVNRKKKG